MKHNKWPEINWRESTTSLHQASFRISHQQWRLTNQHLAGYFLTCIKVFTQKTNHTALTVLCLGFQRLSSAALRSHFCQRSKVTDELVTGVAGTCQQLCHRNRRHHGNLVWTCQLWKPGDGLFLLYHYSATDMPAGVKCHAADCKTTKTITHPGEWYRATSQSMQLCWVQIFSTTFKDESC